MKSIIVKVRIEQILKINAKYLGLIEICGAVT